MQYFIVVVIAIFLLAQCSIGVDRENVSEYVKDTEEYYGQVLALSPFPKAQARQDEFRSTTTQRCGELQDYYSDEDEQEHNRKLYIRAQRLCNKVSVKL